MAGAGLLGGAGECPQEDSGSRRAGRVSTPACLLFHVCASAQAQQHAVVQIPMPIQRLHFAVKVSYFDQSDNHHAASSFAVQHSMLLSLLLLILVAFTGCNVLVAGGVCMHRNQSHWKSTAEEWQRCFETLAAGYMSTTRRTAPKQTACLACRGFVSAL